MIFLISLKANIVTSDDLFVVRGISLKEVVDAFVKKYNIVEGEDGKILVRLAVLRDFIKSTGKEPEFWNASKDFYAEKVFDFYTSVKYNGKWFMKKIQAPSRYMADLSTAEKKKMDFNKDVNCPLLVNIPAFYEH